MKEVSITDAATILKVSVDNVRRRIKQGELKARKVASPHGEIYLVEIPDGIVPVPSDLQEKKEENPTEVETIEAMKKTISVLENELDTRRREVQELHVLLQRAQKQLSSGKSESAPNKTSWWRRMNPWGKH
jgi:DNA-directed RNA polymerase specialized sigma24 family protein